MPQVDEQLKRGRAPRGRGLLESALSVVHSGSWMARLWGLWPGSTRVQVVRHELGLLPPGSPRLLVAFLSDIHIGPTTPPALLDNAFELVERATPDVVVLGGDYLFLSATDARLAELERRVGNLTAPVKLAILGNHDLWSDFRAIERALERGGAELLTNRSRRLPAPHEEVAFVGLDEPQWGVPDPNAAVAHCGDAALRLGVCHSPDGLDLLADAGLALLLCGHTHGGHIATPWGAPFVPGRAGRRYPHGLHRVGETHLYVSRGLGGISIPFRTWAPPDVGIIELRGV
ncbi:metallophosphoesterase [Engelhardtia mirabilis]|uniref:Putative metallophosphoesterase n=1 Tax=Engelhardtia mirabilis TaxID=2528011 RepID=A0A518BIY0_9BACT|nr:putative metallophosphoesterase [Planctomycetes bacterium Pla133]QDV01253.1 putative metallophosphoesterase [Planctomycetes bacterium Pla86]